MDGSVPFGRDANSMIPTNDSHNTDGAYTHNAPSNPMPTYGGTYPFGNTSPPPNLNQMIAAFSMPQQTVHGQNQSPAYTNSPTIFSPATPIYLGQSPSLSTPLKSPYSPHSPHFSENPSLFSLGAGRPDQGWAAQSSPHNHIGDLQYANSSSTTNFQPGAPNSDSSHIMPNTLNTFGQTSPDPGSRAWLLSRISNLLLQQRAEVESRYETWSHNTDKQILVVNILCEWFEHGHRPAKEDLLKFYRARLGISDDIPRSRGAKGGQGARGGAVGYTCEWPGCGKSLSGRTDRVHEDALNHLNIKIFACDAPDCNASFLRKNELNRHVKSCRSRPPNATVSFLSTPSSPSASTSRQSTNRPGTSSRTARRNTRSLRGVSADISPPSSGRDSASPLIHRMTDSLQFLPQGPFQPQPQPQHTPQVQVPGFGSVGDGQMTFNGQPHALHHANTNAHAHAHHQHTRNNSNPQQMVGVSGTGDVNPMAAYATDQFPVPSSSSLGLGLGLGPRASPPQMHTYFHNTNVQQGQMQQQQQQQQTQLRGQDTLMVPSQVSPSTSRDELTLPTTRRVSITPPRGYAFGQQQQGFYLPPGSFSANGNDMSGYGFYSTSADQQQQPRQSH